MLCIRLIGELEVEDDGRQLELPAGRARSLLAWLALNRGSHRRSEVAPRFWPDIRDDSARASLRTAVWALRKAFGDAAPGALIATRDQIGIVDGPTVWTDVSAFEGLAAEGRPEEALELSRGELLADLDEDWVLEAREEHADRVREALARLAREAESRGDLERAIDSRRRQASIDPLAEDAHRELIRLQALAGDRARAISTYERLRRRLREELGLAPSPATRQLAGELRMDSGLLAEGTDAAVPATEEEPAARPGAAGHSPGRSAPGARSPRGRGTEPSLPLPPDLEARLDTPFVGRSAELERLRRAFAEVRDAAIPRLVLLSGEAGIGKSRLAAELAREAHAGEAIVLSGAAVEGSPMGHRPYVEPLRHYAAHAPAEETEKLAGLPGFPAPDEPASDAEAHGVPDAVASLLEGLAGERPVLLLLDDLQWAWQADIALLGDLLAPSRGGASLLVIASCREQELDRAGSTAELLARLRTKPCTEHISLSGLGAAEVEALCRERTGKAELSATIHVQTGGNPFFVGEALRHLEETGGKGPRDSLGLPAEARKLIERRLVRNTSQTCSRALGVAAVIGTRFDLDLLEQVSGLDGRRLEDVLEEAMREGLLVELEEGFGRFAFAQPLIREALVSGMSRTVRARVHARVAQALEELDADLARIAHHWCEAGRAGDAERAIGLADRAAEQASSAGAYGEAVELESRALALLSDSDPRRAGLLMRRAVDYMRLEHHLFVRVHGVSVDVSESEPRGS